MNLKTLLSALKYPPTVENAIRSKIQNGEDEISRIAKTAYTGDDFQFALCRHEPELALTVVTYLLLAKYGEYRARGVPEQIIMDTFRDVSLRASLYYRKYGGVGITQEDVIWFRHIMNIGIFQIGTLQFQPFEMIYLDEETIGEAYMEFPESCKIWLPAGAPVINIHIQQDANLDPKAVGDSLRRAKAFFATLSPQISYKAFLCYSWLLYPPMVRRLSKQSNIRQFAEKFQIIGACDDAEQAWENLQSGRETQLVKMAKDQMHLFGYACGIMNF